MTELLPRYNPSDVEERLYQQWESQKLFRAEPDSAKTPYTIVIPPPNVTGILHMGHALNNTIQDILIRFKRMQGCNALWVPGTDHAGIATQNVVERQLAKEKLRRQDLGREEFLKRVWVWKEQYGNTIIQQLKRLGASCDWARTRFTMDEGLSEAVAEVFVRLYDKGLIYRGNYIINWCPRCQTALSDEEAPRKETRGKLYYIKYTLKAGERLEVRGEKVPTPHTSHLTPHTYIVVATTRPETMLGDTAIAVHPKDKRYKRLIGASAILPFVNRELPIIADELVDPEFGTGAVKVTPAHDPVDFQLGKKHSLGFINVMTDDGHMTGVPVPYQGLDRLECRRKVLEDLEQEGCLEKVADHLHAVGHCYRCDTIIEPRLSLQWFVKMKPLAEPAIQAVKDRTITFMPSRWTKVYLNWMENIQDWCISRQIWWGHRLPVYYCQSCVRRAGVDSPQSTVHSKKKTVDRGPWTVDRDGVIVSKTRPERCPACGGTELAQDDDVLDTWFSSWLWPFSTLGWPKDTKDLACFYPTNTLVTAPEIIFFWVARMIMAGYFCMKKPPFTRVYIHGTVRDVTGKKMSKSLGNIIDPLDIIAQYGTDALRYTLVTASAVGQDIFLSEERFAAGRNFANKLWNAARFILQSVPPGTARRIPPAEQLSVFDRALLHALNVIVRTVTEDLERFDFNAATEQVYGFLWREFCDWHIEFVKPYIKEQPTSQQVLIYVIEAALRLLHPVMPFISEELWQRFRTEDGAPSVMVAPWPQDDGTRYPDAVQAVTVLTQIISSIRSIRAEFRVPSDVQVDVTLALADGQAERLRGAMEPQIRRLAKVGHVTLKPVAAIASSAVAFVIDGGAGCVHLGGLIDVEKERRRIEKELCELRPHLQQIQARLADDTFVSRAPAHVHEKEVDRKQQLIQRIEMLESYLKVLK